ncbi:MAG: FAD-dependent oxidoreductase [Lentisphaeria bacterium]|nr:FAD-dependent oxidoreductase [Lentisphaeria bacterium]
MGADQHIDCLVVGGGPAGLAAAVTAARRGLRVSLVERWDRLGGTPVAGFHNQLCGYYAHDPGQSFRVLNGGFVTEFVHRLDGRIPRRGQRVGRVEIHPFRWADFETVSREMAAGEGGLDVCLATAFAGARTACRRVTEVDLRSASGRRWTARPRAVIDCSGGAVIQAVGAGWPESPSDPHPAVGFSVSVSGLKNETDALSPVRVPYVIRQRLTRVKDQVPHWAAYTTFSPAGPAGEGVLRLNIPAAESAAVSPATVAERLVGWLREDLDMFADGVIRQMSPWVLPRDGHRLMGRDVLTEQDVMSGKQPGETCVKSAWPIEFWGAEGRPEYGYMAPGACYGIGRGCLRALAVDNLFAAGRCLSAEPRALASCRVAGTSFSTGEAAAEEAVTYLNNG